ncbi:MAG: hypothetical protein FD157_1312 [Rhodocyclaceae bacterium]|nr:MAG: hypothetical protein FD157_1312 [Rhodocyclaceae bacterium]TND05722.1 MAG: hypothetical protein FD118_420 [Rhodocyclaceae bacterium]
MIWGRNDFYGVTNRCPASADSAGRTDEGRLLHLTFTLRKAASLIRVISARDMHRKERTIYEQAD